MTRKFYRDKKKGLICGVCSGFANFTGANLILIRIVFVICSVLSLGTTLLIYILIALLTQAENSSQN